MTKIILLIVLFTFLVVLIRRYWLTFNIKMMSNVRSKQDWQITKCSIKERFEELLLLSQWTDCGFSVGEDHVEVIKCHKLVLAVSSPVFEALFFGGLSKNTEEIISVPDIEPYTFRLLLGYIYSDTLDLKNVNDAGDLLYAAKKYLMPQLARICLDYLLEATGIKSLWDILAIAEALNEEELLAVCLKVMSRYPYDIWSTEEDHLSGSTLARLFDLKLMNMKEPDLWKFLLNWSAKECQLRDEPVTPESMRKVLVSVGVLSKVRFLVFTSKEFQSVKDSGILTEKECLKLESLIYKEDREEVPEGFCIESAARLTVAPVTWRCTRESIGGARLLTYSVPALTKISSTSRVLVTGFEVVTRLSSVSYPKSCLISSGNIYRERLVAFIKDDRDNVISRIDHDGNAEYNSNQTIRLNRPVWFDSGVTYTIIFLFPAGGYPLCYFADTVLAKGTTFLFDDILEKDNFKSKGSCITSVLYSI